MQEYIQIRPSFVITTGDKHEKDDTDGSLKRALWFFVASNEQNGRCEIFNQTGDACTRPKRCTSHTLGKTTPIFNWTKLRSSLVRPLWGSDPVDCFLAHTGFSQLDGDSIAYQYTARNTSGIV